MSKIAIISDVHGNLQALESVLKDIEKQDVSGIYCLGDVVGYGARPNECTEMVMKNCSMVVLGNHDAAASGLEEPFGFNDEAKQSILWTRGELTQSNRGLLATLKRDFEDASLDIYCHHSAPHDYGNWIYLDNTILIMVYAEKFEHSVCFVGHTHKPRVTSYANGRLLIGKFPSKLNKKKKSIVNVGSVGQPRDNDPRAAYVVYDSRKGIVELHRVEYTIEQAIQDINKTTLPEVNGLRLRFGG